MPRKTREEKKLAEYRRRLKLLENTTKPQNLTEQKKERAFSKDELPEKNFFKQDLKKSLLFILLIFTVEIAIYFVTIKI